MLCAVALSVQLATWSSAFGAECAPIVGDANCDCVVNILDLDAVVAAPFHHDLCPQADVNGDHVFSAADLPAEIRILSVASPTATATATATSTPTASPTVTGSPPATLTPTLSPTTTATATASATASATATITPTQTATSTITPTPALCPTDGADLLVTVDNRTGTDPLSVTLSGHRIGATCMNQAGLDETYTTTGVSGSQTVAHLAPGVWVHGISAGMPATGQQQYQRSLLLSGAGANAVRFTAFASVASVRSTADNSQSGTLRSALMAAQDTPKPFLIQFDEDVFPPGDPTVIQLSSALPVISTTSVTIDGTDSGGEIGNRGIDAGGLPIPALAITGASNSVVGLHLLDAGANNRDVVNISGVTAVSNVVDGCFIEQAASGDGIGVDSGAGADFLSSANVVRNCEIAAAADKGIKVTTNAYARVENNWVHDNLNGAIQATLSGHIFARDNLAEHSGGASAQNGLSVNGSAPDTPLIASELMTDGNISRFNAANGISVRGQSIGFLNNDYLSANGSSGLRVFDDVSAAAAVVAGTAAVCNGTDGGVVADHSTADFGGGAFGSPGNNAFTQNNLPNGANLRNATGALVFAVNDQWEHCGTASTCDDAAIAAYDLSDHGAQTVFSPAQAQRDGRPPAVTGVRPTKGVAGDLLRIFGSGFNVIDGHAADATCPDVTSRNRCVPLRGNCVRIGGVPAAVEAITPTMIVVRLPVPCVQPVPLTVQTQGGGISVPAMVCTNSGN